MLLTEFLIQHREFAHGLSAGDIGVGLVDVLLDKGAHRVVVAGLGECHVGIEALTFQPGMQHFGVELDKCGHERLAVADYYCMSHDRAGVDDILHRGGADVLAAGGDDDVLLASGNEGEAAVVDTTQIAGFDPAVGSHRLCGEFGLLVVAKEHVRAGQLNFIVFAKTHAHARPRLADRTDLVVVLPIDEHRSGGFGHAITLDEGDVIHAVEKVGQIHVERRTTAGQPFEVRSESGTNGFAHRGHVERMAHALDERMAATGLLILAPLDEVLDRLGEDMPLDAGTSLLRGRVIHLLEHTWHAQQVGGLEAADIGEQSLGVGNVSDHAAATDAHVLDVAGEAVRQRQEQQQTVVVVQHATQNLVAVKHDVRVIAVGEHRALGLAGGTGGVDHGEQIIGFDTSDSRIQRLIGYAMPEVSDSVKAIGLEIEHVFHARMIDTDLLKRLCALEVAGKGDGGIDFLDDARGLTGGIGLIDGHNHSADCRASEISHTPLIAGRRVNQHHGAGFDAKSQQALGHLAYAGQHFSSCGAAPLVGVVILPFRDDVIRRASCSFGQQRVDGVVIGGDISGFFYMFTHGHYYRRTSL